MRLFFSLIPLLLAVGCNTTPVVEAGSNHKSYLASLGASKSFIEAPDNATELSLLARGFQSGRYPVTLAPLLSQERNNILALQDYAEKDPSFRDGRASLRDAIKAKLIRREHQYRKWADYSEHFSNVDKIEDVHMLVLLKQYTDFFARVDVIAQLPSLFAQKEESESGGLILWSKAGLQLVPLRSFDNTEERAQTNVGTEYFYRIPLLVYHIPNIGLFHTHPIESGVNPEERAGPSCSCLYGQTLSRDANDTDVTVAKILAQTNPHFMHVVITELGDGAYNVDAYFFDLRKKLVGDAENILDIIVIDLGIFYTPTK